MKPKIGLVWIVVADLEKAVDYYSNVLGFELAELHPHFGWAELCNGKDGARLGLAQANDMMSEKAGSNAIITVSVDDIEVAKDELSKKGVTFIGEVMEVPGHVKMQMISDSDGNKLQLVQLL